ncbi:MAG: IS66 family insertion sequence element accessory protein TnpB [Steroidobacteraceae bacterium]
MLRPERSIERVYLHRAPVDMRRQMDGLALLARDVMQIDPLSGALFVFINRRRNKLKCLTWENNGFVIWYKRLEVTVRPGHVDR